MLATFVTLNRAELVRRCQAKVTARSQVQPEMAGTEAGLPLFLDQLVDALQHHHGAHAEIDRRAAQRGRDLHAQGVTVSQVVLGYGDVCQAITDLAVATAVLISVEDFRTLNRCLDDAIASAVTEYARVSATIVAAVQDGDEERLGFFVHELRNLVNTASMAFAVLDKGDPAARGRTGGALKRSLTSLGTLIDRSVIEMRLGRRAPKRANIAVAGLLQELTTAAEPDAARRGVRFTVEVGAPDVRVYADREILSAVVVNLLQNGFKFTRPGTCVTLAATTTTDRVMIAVADECGGLSAADAGALFRPFAQGHRDRTGLGLGLAFSKWGAEVSDGSISVDTIPGRGCVFTLDLPRVAAGVH